MMDEKKVQELIEKGRAFMRFSQEMEDDDFVSDQEMKKPQPPLVKEAVSEERVELPLEFEKLYIEQNYTYIVNTRKSSRVFTQETMSLLELSYLLWTTQGIKEIRGKSYATLRTVPSGGARHGFETYLMVRNCEPLKPGMYHYLPMDHELEYLGTKEDMEETISKSLCGQAWASKANVVFYWSFIPYRCEWRYGIHAHRTALIDAGHVGENLYLSCSALHLGTCGIAAFDDATCNQMFQLDGKEEYVVYTAPVGTIDEDNEEAEESFYKFVEEQGL